MAAITVAAVALLLFKNGAGGDAQASTPENVSANAHTSTEIAPPVAVNPPIPVVPDPPVAEAEADANANANAEPSESETTESRPADASTPGHTRRTGHTRRASPTRHREDEPAVAEVEPPGRGCLDEVACLLASDPPPCCRKYPDTIKDATPDTEPVTSNLPLELDRETIKQGMKNINSRVSACMSRSSARGTVTLSIKVAGSGRVSRVKVKQSPDNALGSCVVNAVKKARFPETRKGKSFSYPFLFR